jgi:predicted nucleic acid-binding Zn ribbon protein
VDIKKRRPAGDRRAAEHKGKLDATSLRNNTEPQHKQADRCLVCGDPISANRTGRPPKFCSNACRQKAYRDRDREWRKSLREQKFAATENDRVEVPEVARVGCALRNPSTVVPGRLAPQSQDQKPAPKSDSKLDRPRIERDPTWAYMFRVRMPDGSVSELLTLSKAKALAGAAP